MFRFCHQKHSGGGSRGFINTVVVLFAGTLTFFASIFAPPLVYSAPITYDFTEPVNLATIEYLPMPEVAGVATTTVIESITSLSPPPSDTTFLTFALGALATTLRGEMQELTTRTLAPQVSPAIWTAIAHTNKIDQLSGTTLTNIIVSGVSGLTDADIPDGITASNYLPLSGGTLTGATTTNLTVTATASTSDLVASNSFTFKTVTGFLKATAGVVATALIDLANDVTGILPIANGGTGTSTAPTYGKVLLGNSGGTYDLVATSSLGISGGGGASAWGAITGTLSDQTDLQSALDAKLTLASWYATTTDGLAEGITNKYWSNTLFDNRLSATTSLPTITTLANLTITESQISDFDTSVNTYIHASTTIPKTYTANTFSGANTFNSTLTIASLTGPLQAIAGVISATSTISDVFITDALTISSSGSVADGALSATVSLLGTTIAANELASADFGDFTCNGTTCALDADTVSDAEIDYTTVTLADFTNDAGFTTFLYPFPANATSTALSFTGGLSTTNLTVTATASTSDLVASNSFTLGTLSGFLKATAGVVATALIDLANDVTGILPIANGGTGTSTAPTYGKVLLGNSGGTYDLVATSSLGISANGSGIAGQFPYYAADGTTLTATSSVYLTTTGNLGIGTTTPTYRLSVEGISSLGNQAIAGYFTATSTTASTFAGGIGVGSTTPWAQLSVNPNGLSGPSFVVGSSTATNFIITNGGNVGVGTTSPLGRFAVQGAGSGTGTLFNLANSAFTTVMNVLDNGVAYVLGNLGVGTSTPWRKFSVTDTVSSPQVAIAYDATRYAQLQVDSVGDLILSAQGGDVYLANENLFACTNGCPAGSPTGLGNILAENKLGLGTTTPVSKLTIETQDASTDFFQVASSTAQSIFGIFANGRVGIATSSPWKALSVSGDGVLTGTLYFADGVSNIAPTTCPSGMIPVPGSAADGQPGFCVDKYEVKGATTSPPVSSAAAGTPLVSITQYNARAACVVAGKHLITEKEWLTIAHNVENVGWNWNGGVAGTNQMSDGHSDNVPAGSLAADVTGAADDDPCVGTGQTCSLTTWDSQRRTYQLSNGEYIWDFGGDVWEWVDQVVSDDYPILNSPTAGWQVCSTSGDGICGNTRTTNDQWYRGGTTATRGFIRGGDWVIGADAGAFALYLGSAPSLLNTYIGFRCSR